MKTTFYAESDVRLHPLPTKTRFVDITGEIFGRFKVLGLSHKQPPSGIYVWWCRCLPCGKIVRAWSHTIRPNGQRRCIHSLPPRPEHDAWKGMLTSTLHVHGRWRRSFDAFLKDLGPRPDGRALCRIDLTKGFTPRNCEWGTINRARVPQTTMKPVTFRGKRQTLMDHCRDVGLRYSTVIMRMKSKASGGLGWSVRKALSTKRGRSGRKPTCKSRP